MDENYETVKLCYTIHKYSSYSAKFIPENIMVNSPSDQLSRWFTDSTAPQFIVLKLKSPSIVESIKFGKFIKPHVSDLKKFQILGGTDENSLSLLLSGGLKKDSNSEIFRLRHRTSEGLYLPVTYIKIVPLQSWGPAFNYTIWYVELQGKNQEDLITNAMETISLRKEEEAVRILLKHLRRRRYKEAFDALSRESGVKLEGPIQAQFWDALVEDGDFARAEEIFDQAVQDGEIDWYLSWQPFRPQWRLLSPCSPQVEARLNDAPKYSSEREATAAGALAVTESPDEFEATCGGPACCEKPGPRGGHQLVVDPSTGLLYLFGGWNGTADLDDLWCFDPDAGRWRLLCAHSGEVGGPSPRSCHKMVLCPREGKLYTLGRYLDNIHRVPDNMNSELYSYDIGSGMWSLECADTAAAGGPRLVFDHQMCIDERKQTIYVFGGRVLPPITAEGGAPQYSGLYAYRTGARTWRRLLPDQHDLDAPQPRVSHSMLFHPRERRLYMFAGQRNKQQLVDLWWWDVDSGARGAVLPPAPAPPPPQPGFTQRATLDPHTDHIFVLSGMSKEKEKRVYNTMWAYSLASGAWSCVYRSGGGGGGGAAGGGATPRPRFAHQLVLDPARRVHYLFGGNPGCGAAPRLRLDDLWALRLARAGAADVRRAARAALREACYRALCAAQAPGALAYLRGPLRRALEAGDAARWRRLATLLFAAPAPPPAPPALCPRRAAALAARRARRPPPADPDQLAAVLLSADGAEGVVPPEPVAAAGGGGGGELPGGGGGGELPAPDPAAAARHARARLYDELSQYFRPGAVPPAPDVTDLVAL